MTKHFTQYISLFLLLFSSLFIQAQVVQGVTLGPDTTLCNSNIVNVRATFTGGNGELTNLSSDDEYSDTIDIGFPFTFYGNTYTKCNLSTNGYLTFDLQVPGSFSTFSFPNPCPDPTAPLNSIYGVARDLDPRIPGGVISYGIIGTAPNRIFVFNTCNVPMYQCNSLTSSHQIFLYEGSNNVEVHVGLADYCAWGNNLLGMQNATGTIGIAPPGRNSGAWIATSEAWRFTPAGANYNVTSIPFAPQAILTGLNSYFYIDGVFAGSGTSIDVMASDTVEIWAVADTNTSFTICGIDDSLIRNSKYVDTMMIYNGAFEYNESSSAAACLNSTNNSIRLDANGNIGTGNFNFQWEDTSGIIRNINRNTSPAYDSLNGIVPGRYWYTISNGICSYRDSVQLSSLLYFANFTHQTAPYCVGEMISFHNTSTGSYAALTYDFGDGVIDSFPNPYHAFNTPGPHTVKLIIYTFTGCTDTASVELMINYPPSVELGNDTTICDDKTVVLDAGTNWDNCVWQDASTNRTFTVNSAGLYKAIVSNECGSVADSIQVNIQPCECKLAYPDAFTPNDDNKNETYAPLYTCSGLSSFNMRIFNRWGNLVYETNDINQGWNGKFHGKDQPIGTYVYSIKATSQYSDKPIETNGVFSLIR